MPNLQDLKAHLRSKYGSPLSYSGKGEESGDQPRRAPKEWTPTKRDRFPFAAPTIDRDVLIPGVDLLCGLPNQREVATVPAPAVPWPTYRNLASQSESVTPHHCYTERQGPKHKGMPKVAQREWNDLVEGLFIGSFQGYAVVYYQGQGAFAIPAHRIAWHRALDSQILLDDFIDGYRNGWESAWDGNILGNRSEKRVPTDSGRGFAKAFNDFAWNLGCRVGRFEPYNEAVRKLQTLYPDEWGQIPQAVIHPFEVVGYGPPDKPGPPLILPPGVYPEIKLL